MSLFIPTFGAFGDFTAIVQIVLATCGILTDCYYASQERQDIIDFLTDFNNSLALLTPLTHMPTTRSNRALGPAPFLHPLAVKIISRAVDVCHREIEQFQLKLTQVCTSRMERDSSGRWIQFKQRLWWTLSLKQKANQLCFCLKEQRDLIQLALGVSNV